MTHTFECDVSLHSWLLWLTLRRQGLIPIPSNPLVIVLTKLYYFYIFLFPGEPNNKDS